MLITTKFVSTASGSAQPRGLFVQGHGFVESETQTGGVDPAHTALLSLLQALAYGVYSRDAAQYADRIKAFRLK